MSAHLPKKETAGGVNVPTPSTNTSNPSTTILPPKQTNP